MNWKSKNLVVDQSPRLDVSAGVCWSLEEVGSNAMEGDVLTIWEEAVKEQTLPSSMLLYRLPAEGMSHIKGMSSCFKICICPNENYDQVIITPNMIGLSLIQPQTHNKIRIVGNVPISTSFSQDGSLAGTLSWGHHSVHLVQCRTQFHTGSWCSFNTWTVHFCIFPF